MTWTGVREMWRGMDYDWGMVPTCALRRRMSARRASITRRQHCSRTISMRTVLMGSKALLCNIPTNSLCRPPLPLRGLPVAFSWPWPLSWLLSWLLLSASCSPPILEDGRDDNIVKGSVERAYYCVCDQEPPLKTKRKKEKKRVYACI